MRARIRTTLISLLFALIAVAALLCGIKLRRDVFNSTMDSRFTRNIMNAWLWGRAAQADGLFHIYDDVLKGERFPNYFDLDYPPLRLAIATAWEGYAQRKAGDSPPKWHPEYDYNAPILWTDTIAAMLGSVMAFLLVRMWVVRMDDASLNPSVGETRRDEGHEESTKGNRRRSFRGVWQGMLAALLIWFNPAVLWNGYVWVQWDIWPVPFYLAAILLASLDWWFAAGMCLAVGCCFKGQLLIASPMLLVWPLWRGRFGAMLRLISGMSLAFMMVMLPWLNPSKLAICWFFQILIATGLLAPIILRHKLSHRSAYALSTLAVLLAWPWTSPASVPVRLLAMAILGMIVLSRFINVRVLPHVYALAVAMAIALMIPLYSASTSWYIRGFAFGAEHSIKMHDVGTFNVPALLQDFLKWPNDNRYIVAKWPWPIPMKTAAVFLYVLSLLLCGFFAARFERRRDARFLLAVFLPWLMLYMLLPQMFSRYLLWAGAISGILAGVGIGLTLLGVLISLIALAGMVENHYEMIGYGRDTLVKLQAVEPHLGWMLALIMLVMIYCMCRPRPKMLKAQ